MIVWNYGQWQWHVVNYEIKASLDEIYGIFAISKTLKIDIICPQNPLQNHNWVIKKLRLTTPIWTFQDFNN